MADREPRQPTHRAYSVIKREGQEVFTYKKEPHA